MAWILAGKVLGKEDFQEVVKIIDIEAEKCAEEISNLDEKQIQEILRKDRKMTSVRKALKGGIHSGALRDRLEERER